MMAAQKIQYYKRSEIDLVKWNRCIDLADNGLVYAQSFYLDIMCVHWDALVLNDYEAVMPLTWKKKYGFYYLYQPYFIPSLGIFGSLSSNKTVRDFLSAIPKKFSYWDIKLNETNYLPGDTGSLKISITTGINYLLKLDRSYEYISGQYKRLCTRMLKRATVQQVQIIRTTRPAEVINFYQSLYEDKHEHIAAGIYSKLIEAADICINKNMAKGYLAKLPGGEIAAAYLVLVDGKFVYSLIGGSSEKGKQTGSFYLLTDAVIKDNAASGKVFRFEGSGIQGIAFFNEQFGPALTKFNHLISNRLPFPFNVFKRKHV